jgi:hypothetical protein
MKAFIQLLIILCFSNHCLAQYGYGDIKSAEKQRAIDNERNKERDRQNADNNRPFETNDKKATTATPVKEDYLDQQIREQRKARDAQYNQQNKNETADQKQLRIIEWKLRNTYNGDEWRRLNYEKEYYTYKINNQHKAGFVLENLETFIKTSQEQDAKLVAEYDRKKRFEFDKPPLETDSITDFTKMDIENPIGKPIKKQPKNLIQDSQYFCDGLAFVNCRSQYGYEGWTFKNKNNEILAEPFYKSKSNFVNGYAVVSYKDGEFCIINRSGEVVVKNIKTKKLGNVYDDMCYFEENGKFGFVNIKGKIIAKPIYEKAWNASNGLVKVQLNNKFGFINNKGEIVVQIMYDDATDFSKNQALVKRGDLFYKIDKSGNESPMN